MLILYLIAAIRGFGKYYLVLSGSEQYWWAKELESGHFTWAEGSSSREALLRIQVFLRL